MILDGLRKTQRDFEVAFKEAHFNVSDERVNELRGRYLTMARTLANASPEFITVLNEVIQRC